MLAFHSKNGPAARGAWASATRPSRTASETAGSTGTDFLTRVTAFWKAIFFALRAGLSFVRASPMRSIAFLELLHRGRVGDADVVVGAEGVARDDGDPAFLEQVVGHAVGVPDGRPVELHAVIGADVGEEVERSLRLEAGHARHRGELHVAVVPPPLELGDHLGDLELRAGQGLDARLLGDRRRVRGRVALDRGPWRR